MASARFDQVVLRGDLAQPACWRIRPEVLYPSVDLAAPQRISFVGGSLNSQLEVQVEWAQWSHWADFIAGLAGDPGADQPGGPLAPWLDELRRKGFLVNETATTTPGDGACVDLSFIGHNTVVAWSGATRIVIDPFFVAELSQAAYRPVTRRQIGSVDAVLITHSHADHFDPASLLQFGRGTPIVVPRVGRESLLAIHMAQRCAEFGFERVITLDWNETQRIGDFEIRALPFFGEQPTSGNVLHPEVRNHGNTYHLRCPNYSVAFVADAGWDHAGDMLDVAKSCRGENGPVDVLFAGFRGWLTYPVQLVFSSVAQYLLFVPPQEWGQRQQLMNDPVGAVDLAEAWDAQVLVPYGAGGAPWYWQRGLGPRNEPDAIEDPNFDPLPARVEEAASRRRSA